MTSNRNPFTLLGAWLAIGVVTANAQGMSQPPDETVTLSPFQVNAAQDTGYQATNTLEGSRLNTPLRDTPGAISIFAKDFLNDIGATDLESILRYDLSAEI